MPFDSLSIRNKLGVCYKTNGDFPIVVYRILALHDHELSAPSTTDCRLNLLVCARHLELH